MSRCDYYYYNLIIKILCYYKNALVFVITINFVLITITPVLPTYILLLLLENNVTLLSINNLTIVRKLLTAVMSVELSMRWVNGVIHGMAKTFTLTQDARMR